MRKTLKVVAFGGGPADAFIKAAGITDSTQQTAIKTLVNDLNGYGLWSKMKAIYPMVGGNATAHSYNLKDTTKFQITFSGGWTHSSNGALPNGTNGYASTKLNAFVSLTNNNTHLSFYSRTSTITNGVRDMAAFENAGLPSISLGTNTGVWISDQNDFNIRISSSIASATGFYTGTRTSSISHKLYKNGAILGTNTSSNSQVLPNINIFIGAANIANSGETPSSYSNKECAFSTIGDGLSDTEAANLYTSIQKFQTTLNRFVGTPIYTSFDSDAQSFMTSASITDSTQQAAVNYLVTDLKSNNLWSKMLGIYPLVGGTASSHSWNLKDTTKLKMRWVGGMTHDSNGVTGNGTNSYGQPDITGTTGINATNYPPLTETNYGISIYQRNTSAETVQTSGFGYANGYMHASYAGGTTSYFRGITASPDNATNPNKTGLFHMYGGSGVGSGIVNGTKIVTGTGGQLPNTALGTFLWFAGNNGGGYSNRNFAFFTVSEYLNDTEAANLYTIIQNYQTILSRQV